MYEEILCGIIGKVEKYLCFLGTGNYMCKKEIDEPRKSDPPRRNFEHSNLFKIHFYSFLIDLCIIFHFKLAKCDYN